MAETNATSLVEYACRDQVATLTLNRPERLNAFSDDLVRHLADALRRFDLDPEAQVAVICGRGRAFSSGADVHQRQLRKREEFEQHGGPQGWGANSGDLLTRSVNWKPVIAAPHGYALGLALAAGIINRVAPTGTHLEVARELAAAVAKNPPLSVRATVRTRRWYMDQLEREVTMQTAPLKLYLSEDFREAARAFAEKRQPGPFKGR